MEQIRLYMIKKANNKKYIMYNLYFIHNANHSAAAVHTVRSTELDWFILLIVRYQGFLVRKIKEKECG